MEAATEQAVLADSTWLAHRYDDAADSFHFCNIPWAERAAIPFLSEEALQDRQPRQILSAHQIDPKSLGGAPLHFIFHSAFCASTLLSKALGSGPVTSLSEPQVLNDMIGALRRGKPAAEVARALDQALALLSRPMADRPIVVLKPSNLVNHLAQAMMMLRPDSRAVFLYAPLEVFLGSVARKGLWCRLWVRELLDYQRQLGMVPFGLSEGDYFRLTDLQVAAIGWLTQYQLFSTLRAGPLGARILMLTSEQLTDAHAGQLPAIAQHFGLDAAARAQVAASPELTRHSKFGQDFSAEDRVREREAALASHADEIEKVALWAREVARRISLTID